jgi:hypothetical protein
MLEAVSFDSRAAQLRKLGRRAAQDEVFWLIQMFVQQNPSS